MHPIMRQSHVYLTAKFWLLTQC